MFAVSVSASKWVTDPAFEVGRLVASPIAKMFGAAFACSVCRSAGTKSGVVAEPGRAADVRGAAVQRDRHQQVERLLPLVVAAPARRPAPSTSPVLNSVTSSMPFVASMPARSSEAAGFVNAPSSGVT